MLFSQADIDAVSVEDTLVYSPSSAINCRASCFFPADANSMT
jgi:hypothetical protein